MKSGFSTKYWHKAPNGKVQCDLCPRGCQMAEGQRGLCFVRGVEGGEVKLFSYGRSSGFCIDPIEKKPLNHFYPGTSVLSFGTAGCNLTCKFCQNWDISKSRDSDRLQVSATPFAIANLAKSEGCISVAYTYNDPTIFMEYAIDTAKACHELGIKNVAVTAGYINPEPRAEFFSHMDAANIDLKGFSEDFYHKVCSAQLSKVLDTIEYVSQKTSTWLELTTLLIPGLNDSESELIAMCKWIVSHLGRDVPHHFSAFHPDFRMRDIAPTPKATLIRAAEIARSEGLNYVYLGNVRDDVDWQTCCPKCDHLLIARDGYSITHWAMNDHGGCGTCGTAIPGRFGARFGQWGNRRKNIEPSAAVAE